MTTLASQPQVVVTTASENMQWRRIRSLLLSPAIVYLIILTQVPVIFTLYYSVSNWNLLRPDRTAFVGLSNYLDFVQDTNVLIILRNTLIFASSVVILSLVFGMLLAMLLNRQFRGRGVARTLLITPFLIMPTVSAVMWKNMLLNPAFGLINSFLVALGGPRVDSINQFPMASIFPLVN